MSLSSDLVSWSSIYRGLYTRVAARLKVSPSYVSKVANGKRRSYRIEKALSDELFRCAALVAKARAKSKRK